MFKSPFVSRKRFEDVASENVHLKERADNLNLYLYYFKKRFPELFYAFQKSFSGMPGYCDPDTPDTQR